MMLRELSQLLSELHDGLIAVEERGGARLSNVELTLPLELRAIFRGGGCVLLADVPRAREVNEWMASPSRLRVAWGERGAEASEPGPRAAPPSDRREAARGLDARHRQFEEPRSER